MQNIASRRTVNDFFSLLVHFSFARRVSFEYPIRLHASALFFSSFLYINISLLLIPLSLSPFTFFFCLFDVFNAAVPCLVINLLNFIRNGRGEWKEKKNMERREGDSFHWLVRTIGSTPLSHPRRAMRATTTTRRSLIIPCRSLFFHSFSCSLVAPPKKDLSTLDSVAKRIRI